MLKTLLVLIICCSILSFCKEVEIEKKIDPNLRLHLKNQKSASQRDQHITIIFKVNENITDSQLQLLHKTDINIISNIGSIYTASLPARKVLDLAKMKFIEYLQSPKKFKATNRDTTKQLPTLKEF
jgi:hypothetical protein